MSSKHYLYSAFYNADCFKAVLEVLNREIVCQSIVYSVLLWPEETNSLILACNMCINVFICSVVPLTVLLISQCSVSCGEGVARRLVTCRIGDQCIGEKPESHKPCRPGPCHGKKTLQTLKHKADNWFCLERSPGTKISTHHAIVWCLEWLNCSCCSFKKSKLVKEDGKYCTMHKFIYIDDIIHGALNHSSFPRMLLWSVNFSPSLWRSLFTPSQLTVESFYFTRITYCMRKLLIW